MKTNIPLFRAKKLDSDEYVNGTYVSSFHKHYIAMINCIHENNYNQIVFDEGYFEEIDTSTLAISVDGITWFSIENLNLILANQEVTGIQE